MSARSRARRFSRKHRALMEAQYHPLARCARSRLWIRIVQHGIRRGA